VTKHGKQYRNPWAWVPSLYLAQGLPYVVVMTVSVIMYKRLDISNTDIALYTSWLYLPWVIKPLWSPVVDLFKTKRFWIITMQLVVGASLASVALTIPLPGFFQWTLAVLWLMAFSSATHDIAADGFYMLGLKEHEQAAFVGVRSTFYRIAMITGQGALVIVAGYFETMTGNIPLAWSMTFGILAALFLLFFVYHKFILPYPTTDAPTVEGSSSSFLSEFLRTFVSFFKKPGIGMVLAFLLLFRFAEAQLVKLASPFLLDTADKGGLALSTSEVGIVYGTVGIIALTLGGLLGGYVISRQGLKFWLLWMVLAINVPDAVYVYLSQAMPQDFILINAAVAVEQFGYGFGFTAYMMYMIYVSQGPHKTAHYAICTGFMALGMMIPGMFSGYIQEALGYENFFIWVCIATIPSFAVAALIKVDPSFGRKQD
jgi:PAT family beta-lactamase induction signal transducer AmpG